MNKLLWAIPNRTARQTAPCNFKTGTVMEIDDETGNMMTLKENSMLYNTMFITGVLRD